MESTQRWRERTPGKPFLLLKNRNAKSIDSFKNKLDEAWKDLSIEFYEQERFIEA